MTRTEMMALPFHPGWDDGREGFVWCRFDALIDPNTHQRAEITWEDDERASGPVCLYPQLCLETNERVGDELKTIDQIVIQLTDEEAAKIIANDPKALLTQYQEQWAKLKTN